MARYYKWLIVIIFGLILSCDHRSEPDPDFKQALKNGYTANEGFKRCIKFRDAWLLYADTVTGLIPRNITSHIDIWNAQDAAADNYPFMVLTSAILDREMYHGRMLDMLYAEKELTSRVGALPDTWSFSRNDFLMDSIDMNQIIFGTSEYIKDGLLPLMEYLGDTPWNDRMLEMLDDLNEQVDVVTAIQGGYGHAPLDEVNGELLQALSRVYWMTGNDKYLKWAYSIGDFYLTEEHLPTNQDYLRLRDHGCEIISGLCELYVTANFVDEEKKNQYQPMMHKMLDRILEVGRNDQGMFYNAINPVVGEIIEEQIADTWGYTLNGYYSIYFIDGIERYRTAVLKVLKNINQYRNHPWEGESADGYADAIESALNLYNRLPSDSAANWIDSEMLVMWEKQKDSGIIEGWHGDGNFARTTIMYCLWKTQGITIDPWREDVVFGAVVQNSKLKFVIKTEKPWEGKIKFDFPRHRSVLNLPVDYPRINQFPEWFTASGNVNYQLAELSKNFSKSFSGTELIAGIPVNIEQDTTFYYELVGIFGGISESDTMKNNNSLTEEEKAEGYTLLFNGQNLDEWIGNKKDYIIEEDHIVIYPDRGGSGNLYTKKEYTDFIFRFEFQLTPGANNGLGIRAALEGDAAYKGMELQIIDNTATMYAELQPYQYHGSLYGVAPAKRGYLKPVGEWNQQELQVRGTQLKVILNNHTILETDFQKAIDEGTMDHNDHPGLKRKNGHIGFLGHGDIVRFRNIRIKKLY